MKESLKDGALVEPVQLGFFSLVEYLIKQFALLYSMFGNGKKNVERPSVFLPQIAKPLGFLMYQTNRLDIHIDLSIFTIDD